MDKNEREALFLRARIALKSGQLSDANRMFEQLLAESENDARFLSYRGLLLAIRERRISEGTAMCKRALTLASTEPEMHLNLARLYSTTGQIRNATETLRRAIRAGVNTTDVMRQIQRVSPRSTPPLPSLHRDHFLNNILGKLRARLFGKSGKRAQARRSAPAAPAKPVRQRG
jgi:tetratricopeptide (TPR) repeat protein